MESSVTIKRCAWAGSDPLYESYHDREWGVPVHDDRLLFEFLTLEGAQAGLSWITILRKREGYRAAFAGFDPELVARFDAAKVAELLANPGIVRNRLKVESTHHQCPRLPGSPGGVRLLRRLPVALRGRQAGPERLAQHRATVPASTPVSDAMSRDLKRRGFRFVGSTICYAHMQAVGMVNDHTVDCFRWRELGGGDVG